MLTWLGPGQIIIAIDENLYKRQSCFIFSPQFSPLKNHGSCADQNTKAEDFLPPPATPVSSDVGLK